MNPIIISLFSHPMLASVAMMLDYGIGRVTLREFPDGETYLQFHDELQGRDVIILDSIDRPNSKIMPILFAAKTALDMGASSVGLAATYLSYMRQDKKFHAGECVTSKYFAELISRTFDWIVTIDPHLHRYHNLNEIYSIPNRVYHAAPFISSWIKNNVKSPVLIGPDFESEQWVRVVAKDAGAPYLIANKIRHGDHDVEVILPAVKEYLNSTPILVDDIISTAHTMLETIKELNASSMRPPICIGVHGIFSDDAYTSLQNAGVSQIVTCNSVPHSSNRIDLSEIICKGILESLMTGSSKNHG